ncbi:uncharacterized protein N7473_010329 [Penicillium subrubescens]|uniref:uncharacterized protein n=1 Tax=Penicillium subrubescens TaxID=1316194 RepID=UPI002544EBBB|nr:uncharacterized protein N7473_010329 [Penicillium subrubescens]KAJ5883443.1 hypothetical protein N7473_010329 [Penicillium subrubescens]
MSLRFTGAFPSEEEARQKSTQAVDDDQNIFTCIEALLRQEQQSKHYQDQLEFKINSDVVEFQRSRAHTLQLQRVVCGLQYQRSQLETSLAHMAEACRVMARDLGFEKEKVQELESRLAQVPSIEYLLQHLAPGERQREQVNGEGLNGHLLLENQHQRELISSLESIVREREEAIRELKSRPLEMMQELRLASFGQHHPGGLSPDEMSKGMSEQSSVEIITERPLSFTQEAKEFCT